VKSRQRCRLFFLPLEMASMFRYEREGLQAFFMLGDQYLLYAG
jgi:hypothetical protein